MSDLPNAILRANLTALGRTEPDLAGRLAQTEPAPLTFEPSREGPLWASHPAEGRPLALASKYDPLGEAQRLLGSYDPAKHACVVLLGIGMGYHAELASRRRGERCLLVVFEPDLAQLRAVLERIDHSGWLGRGDVIFATPDTERSAFMGRFERFGGIATQGTLLVTHPPTRRLHGPAVAAFSELVAEALAYCRTNVATALVNSSRTIRNVTLNLAYYAAGATTNELLGLGRGCPAVCVGAGPSLARNVDLLADPARREKVIVISAQTTLKPLLQRGIRPDFVTALDYHEISRRFYEGLSELPDVTLVAEPKANPTILDHFPGPIRITHNKFLDRLLGNLARPITPIRAGATVAHLSFYLAQHLGCDPIIFIGQDMGFSDGLYYCPGTAIHEVWEPELGTFNTLEMMEWQRIVRHRGHLQRKEDIYGRPIFSDEQMLTYLKQFERDFLDASQTLIDATEGGLPKAHTVRMTLAAALEEHARGLRPAIPLPPTGVDALDGARLGQVRRLLDQRWREIRSLRSHAADTLPLLRRLREPQGSPTEVNRLHERIDRHRAEVARLQEAFHLVNEINTIGAFKRARTDRAIEAGADDAHERQRRQIDRDLENLQFLCQACDEAEVIFRDALQRLVAADEHG